MSTRTWVALVLAPWVMCAGARAQSTLLSLDGDAQAVLFGSAVADAGDVDADGYDDVIVGDWLYSIYEGRAQVYSGADGGLLLTLTGTLFGDRLGYAVDGAGHLDDDAFADLIVGVPQDECDCPNNGHVLLASGADGAVLDDFSEASSEAWVGLAVAGVGDINGDDHDDVLVGAPGWPQWFIGTGRVWLVSGADNTVLAVYNGEAPGDFFGAALAAVGDVDGDGTGDLAIGAPQTLITGRGAGYVRVVSGADASVLLTLNGTTTDEGFGGSVAGPGDIDGDGIVDILVGAAGATYSTAAAGRVAVHSGRSGALLYALDGEQPGDQLGRSVAALGDVDNDGVGDFILGAPGVDVGGSNAGRARVVSGGTGDVLADFDGPATDSLLGQSVAGGGDTDGDGLPDAVIGLPGKAGGPDGGHALVVSLVPTGLALYGHGTAGCAGPVLLTGNAPPTAGQPGFALRCSGAPPSASGVLVLADAQDRLGSDPFGLGFQLHVDAAAASFLLLLDTTSDADGRSTTSLPVPANPALVGRTFYAQAVWTWLGACGGTPPGFASSNGLSLTVQ